MNLETTILEFLSPDPATRKKADETITNYFNSMGINDLSNLYSLLKSSTNNNVKIYISIFIKNFIEQKINSENREQFIGYLNSYKYDILNIILNSNLENKTINLLILSLCKGLSFFQINKNDYYKIIYELSSYILQFYINQKKSENKDVKIISKSLFICSKFMKYIDKDIKDIKLENIFELDKYESSKDNENSMDINNNNNSFELLNVNFYNIIVEDYDQLYNSIFNMNNSNTNYVQLFEYLLLYMKIFKYSLNYLEISNREKILSINYNLNLTIFKQILSSKNITNHFIKYYCDIISLSNKIINKYLSTHISQLTLNTIKNYSSFFYSFISNDNLFNAITNFFKQNDDNNINNTNSKVVTFILDIIDFLYKLIDLIYISFPEYKMIFKNDKNSNNNNFREIIDYINKEFLIKDNIKIILLFIIKKCLIFNEYEIYIAQKNCENFYLCFTEFSSLYDIKTKSGALCNLLHSIFRKKNNDIFKELENNLISLTLKEDSLLAMNQKLSGDELNIKCALLLFFYYIDDYFNLDSKQEVDMIEKIFLSKIDISVMKKKEKEIFSSFIIIRLLTKIVSNSFGQNDFKKKIINIITNIFFSNELKEALIDLACFDLFNEYIDMQPILTSDKNNKKTDSIFPEFFIQNYLIKISQMINKISSPELHSKIIETTNNIISIVHKDQLILDFNIIIPSLKSIWQNKYINNNTNLNMNGDNYGLLRKKNIEIKKKNKKYIVRRDLIKLMSIIIKRIGFYTYNNNNKTSNNNFILFHNFIYEIMSYTFNCIQTEETDYLYSEIYNLMILIQDDYTQSINLPKYNNINDIHEISKIIENDNNFALFCKFYDFFNKIFEQASFSNNQYVFPQLFIVEQFISLCFVPKINIFLESENFVDKIIYILNNMLSNSLNDYHQFIFNIMEYALYIINTFSNFSSNNKNKYTDFVYQFIIKIIKELQLNKSNFDTYFGSIQLANRLINVNTYKNIISEEFNNQIANAIISFYQYYLVNKNEININFIQKNILQNCLYNLIKLFKDENNDVLNTLKKIYKQIKINNKHASSYDSTSIHWLFLFNKITNDLHFYKLTLEEDKLRLAWTQKFEKKQIFFSINKEFIIKYFFLKIDPICLEN